MAFRSAADPKFKQRLEEKGPQDRAAILACINQILHDPHGTTGLRTKKLQGSGVFYSRATRSKRVTWEYGKDRTIVFRNHCDHDQVLARPFG